MRASESKSRQDPGHDAWALLLTEQSLPPAPPHQPTDWRRYSIVGIRQWALFTHSKAFDWYLALGWQETRGLIGPPRLGCIEYSIILGIILLPGLSSTYPRPSFLSFSCYLFTLLLRHCIYFVNIPLIVRFYIRYTVGNILVLQKQRFFLAHTTPWSPHVRSR